jgi:uncharacterized membrane protein YjdF
MLQWLNSIPADKVAHFAVGVLVYALAHFVDPAVGLLSVAVAAVGKEVYDYLHRDRHTPDVWDAVATMLGGLVGFVSGM